jgi:hypothetical protein
MTTTTENVVQEPQKNDKEYNFRQLEAKLQQERQARIEAEQKAEQLSKQQQKSIENEEEDNDSEPYVDHKKFKKTLNKFDQSTKSEIQKAMEIAKQAAKEELKQEMWIENNPDFYDTLKQNADKFAQKHPELAESVFKIPDQFERQKLVYKNIKALGLDKPEQKQPSIQDKIDANRRSPYYQPTGIANSPYAGVGDFSDQGQKQAYTKMQELKKNLRI